MTVRTPAARRSAVVLPHDSGLGPPEFWKPTTGGGFNSNITVVIVFVPVCHGRGAELNQFRVLSSHPQLISCFDSFISLSVLFQELYNAAPADSAPQSVMAKRDNSGYDNSVSNDNVIHSVSGSVGVVHNNNNGGIRKPIPYPTRFDRPGGDYGQLSVTGTPKPPTTELDDLLISVKTTKGYHETRLEMIVKTWYQLAKEQVGCVAANAFFECF